MDKNLKIGLIASVVAISAFALIVYLICVSYIYGVQNKAVKYNNSRVLLGISPILDDNKHEKMGKAQSNNVEFYNGMNPWSLIDIIEVVKHNLEI